MQCCSSTRCYKMLFLIRDCELLNDWFMPSHAKCCFIMLRLLIWNFWWHTGGRHFFIIYKSRGPVNVLLVMCLQYYVEFARRRQFCSVMTVIDCCCRSCVFSSAVFAPMHIYQWICIVRYCSTVRHNKAWVFVPVLLLVFVSLQYVCFQSSPQHALHHANHVIHSPE